MRRKLTILLATVLLADAASAQTQPWVSAYYAGWMQSGYPPSAIDSDAMTHVIHFSLEPGNHGIVNGTGNGITPSAATTVSGTRRGAQR
jgi:hypothetical protein